MECDSPLLLYSEHRDFPPGELPPSKKLQPFCLTYAKLLKAVMKTHDNIVNGSWSIANAKAYLNYHGINTEAVADIIERARNCQTLHVAQAEQADNPAAYAAVLAERNLDPSLFAPWTPPVAWTRGTELQCHLDVPMHLLFLGVVRTCMQQMQEWLKLHGKYSSFLSFASGTLDKIQALALPWCHVLPYSQGKLGGWVSENYIGVARVMQWFYSMIETIAEDPVFQEPNRPQHHWTMVHNRGWLSCRGLDSTGNAEQLRLRVQSYMQMGTSAPEPHGPRGGPVQHAANTICALRVMICHLMNDSITNDDVAFIDFIIRMFLSCFELFDQNT